MKTEIRQIVERGLEQRLPSMQVAQAVAKKPVRGWLRAVREVTGLSQVRIARDLGITRQSYSEMETTEALGSITIRSLERAAGAMGCELVYFILPREGIAHTYRELAEHYDPSSKHLRATEHSMALEGQAVGDLKPPGKKS